MYKLPYLKLPDVCVPVCVSELESRQQRGSFPQDTLLLTVQDRQEPLGSGGATLNALLVAAEHLSNRAGHTVSQTLIPSSARGFLEFSIQNWLKPKDPEKNS